MKYHVEFDIDFRRNPYKGIYIAFEGIDGSGKTTLVKRLKDDFEEKGRKAVLTKEPTRKDQIGTLIHEFLQNKIKIPSTAFQYLFVADRVVHMETSVEPFLRDGKIVITDRCFWSSVVYGILDKIEDAKALSNNEMLLTAQSILSMYHQFIVPDITFYIKVSEETAIKRLLKMSKKKEYYETKEKLKKIKEGYDWLVNKFSNEITVIDGEQSIEDVSEQILKHVASIK